MAVLARGDETFLFRTVGDQAPATADARGRDALLRRAGFENADSAAAPPVRGSNNAAELNKGVVGEQSLATGNRDAGGQNGLATQAAQPPIVAQKGIQNDGANAPANPASGFIECVISMERTPQNISK